MYKSFREMPVWKNAHQISIKVFDLTKELPKSEDYGLTSQIRRSANSVSSNIAEAFGRKTKKDKAYFYIISRASAYETQNHLLYGEGVGYFDKIKTIDLIKTYTNLIYEINKIIKSLSQPQPQSQSQPKSQ